MINLRSTSAFIVQEKSLTVVAGLLWQPITVTNPAENEHKVYEFCNLNQTKQIAVISHEVCLQIGTLQGSIAFREQRRFGTMHAFAVVAKRLFQNKNGFLIWSVQRQDGEKTIAVCLIENDLVVLDTFLTDLQTKSLVEDYIKDHSSESITGIVCNDPELFPKAELLTAEMLILQLGTHSEIRKPRSPRNKFGLIFSNKEIISIVFGFLGVALIGFLFYVYSQRKEEEVKRQSFNTEASQYEEAVSKKIGQLGFDEKSFNTLKNKIESYPLMVNGWVLLSINCDFSGCLSTWKGNIAWDKHLLSQFGEPKKIENKLNHVIASFQWKNSSHLKGFKNSKEIDTLKPALEFCYKEKALMDIIGVNWNCNLTGKPWPISVKKGSIKDKVIHEYPIVVQGPLVLLDYILTRYESQIFWKEIQVNNSGDNFTKTNKDSDNSADLLTFKLTGALYDRQ